jgi:transcription initiation factor TFIIIB Brf1 subunit/transcription initiation factor TFIIB
MKDKVMQNRKCPECSKRCIYHRRKTNDNICVFCGAIFSDKEATK